MNRTSFLAASATLAAAGAAPALAQSVPGGTHYVERRADFDAAGFARQLGRAAEIRQLWEAVAFRPGVWNNVKNSLNGLQFGFGYPAASIAMAWCGHGPSTAYVYSDYVWKKYRIGEFFGLTEPGGAPIVSNIYLTRKSPIDPQADPDDLAGMYQDSSIEMLQERGLVMLGCHTAVEEQSRSIVKRGFAPSGASPADVADDILTHLIPGVVVVPAMVASIAVLQHAYGYTYVTLEL